MKAVLSNAQHPEYGVVSIPLPLPKENYDQCINILEGLEIGSAVYADCKVEEIHTSYPVLNRLEGTAVNVEELDYLMKLLEGFDLSQTSAKFQALAVTQDIHKMRDFINLVFCCQNVPIIQDFTDLEKIGRSCYMDRNGGMMSLSDEENVNLKKVALELLESGEGKITPYGVIYDEGFRLEQHYDGRYFPGYLYEDSAMILELTSEEETIKDNKATYLYLPMSEQQIQRMMLRGGYNIESEKAVDFRIIDTRLPEEAECLIDFEKERISDLNTLCRAIIGMDEKTCEKFAAAVHFARPMDSMELCRLAEELDAFDFIPGVRNAKEYGTYMIMESGHFEYDGNLEEFYDFEKYGHQRIEYEQGEFNQRGYISYHGSTRLEKILGRSEAEQMECGMGGMKI